MLYVIILWLSSLIKPILAFCLEYVSNLCITFLLKVIVHPIIKIGGGWGETPHLIINALGVQQYTIKSYINVSFIYIYIYIYIYMGWHEGGKDGVSF